MIRRPPRSTLFPYTRSSDLLADAHIEHDLFKPRHLHDVGVAELFSQLAANGLVIFRARRGTRSEEHTSELQSRSDLVCRLLLEKKKSKIISSPQTQTS